MVQMECIEGHPRAILAEVFENHSGSFCYLTLQVLKFVKDA